MTKRPRCPKLTEQELREAVVRASRSTHLAYGSPGGWQMGHSGYPRDPVTGLCLDNGKLFWMGCKETPY